MSYLTTQYGEEYVFTTDLQGVSLTVGVYNDSTDTITDSDDVSVIANGTEPSNTNYSRQSDTFSVENPTGSDVVLNNDSQLTYDFSDQTATETVDSYFVVVSFQATIVASDGSPTTHLLFTGALDQDRDIGSIDTLNISAGGVELELE